MSWPSSLSHTVSVDYLTPSDSHSLQRRVGSCFEAPESSTGPDLSPTNVQPYLGISFLFLGSHSLPVPSSFPFLPLAPFPQQTGAGLAQL